MNRKLRISEEKHMKTVEKAKKAADGKKLTMSEYERSAADKKADRIALRRINSGKKKKT